MKKGNSKAIKEQDEHRTEKIASNYKCIASSNKCLTGSNKKLVITVLIKFLLLLVRHLFLVVWPGAPSSVRNQRTRAQDRKDCDKRRRGDILTGLAGAA